MHNEHEIREVCSTCGTSNRGGSTFCKNCGTRMREALPGKKAPSRSSEFFGRIGSNIRSNIQTRMKEKEEENNVYKEAYRKERNKTVKKAAKVKARHDVKQKYRVSSPGSYYGGSDYFGVEGLFGTPKKRKKRGDFLDQLF